MDIHCVMNNYRFVQGDINIDCVTVVNKDVLCEVTFCACVARGE